MGGFVAALLALALPAAAHGAFTAPMRGWMTWERYTCETDCTKFPLRPPAPHPQHPTNAHQCHPARHRWSVGCQLTVFR